MVSSTLLNLFGGAKPRTARVNKRPPTMNELRFRPPSDPRSHQDRTVLLQQGLQLRPELLGLLFVAGGYMAHESNQLRESVAVFRGLWSEKQQAGR